MAAVKKSTNINAGDGVEKREDSCTVGGNATSTATMENSVEIPQNLEIELPYDPAIPLLGIHIEETRIERDMCTPIFMTALYNSQDMETA